MNFSAELFPLSVLSPEEHAEPNQVTSPRMPSKWHKFKGGKARKKKIRHRRRKHSNSSFALIANDNQKPIDEEWPEFKSTVACAQCAFVWRPKIPEHIELPAHFFPFFLVDISVTCEGRNHGKCLQIRPSLTPASFETSHFQRRS
jgi:hypothetical protein